MPESFIRLKLVCLRISNTDEINFGDVFRQ